MASIVYFGNQSNLPLYDDLVSAGHSVWEALAISEVLNLLEHQSIDIVIVAPEIHDERTKEIKSRITLLLLSTTTTTAEVLWDLSNLFPGPTTIH